MLERILVPLDGSNDWESLLPHLEVLAGNSGCEIVVVEAVPFMETLLEMPKAFAGMDLGMGGDTDIAGRYVDSVVAILSARGIRARGITQVGGEVATIARVARAQKATLIALALRATGLFRWRRVQTLAEHVLRASPIPIYAVPSRPVGGDLRGISAEMTVLIPIDGTGLSLQVIPAAAVLCHRMGAKMLFAHVLARAKEGPETGNVFDAARRQADREGIEAETLLTMGNPSEEILKCSAKRGVCMIAMRTRLAIDENAGSLGSVTVRVLRETRVPMLIVRRPPRRERNPDRPPRQSRSSSPHSSRSV